MAVWEPLKFSTSSKSRSCSLCTNFLCKKTLFFGPSCPPSDTFTNLLTDSCSFSHCFKHSACLFRIGQPLSGTQELHELFSRYDTNNSGQLEFNEFLVLFKDRLTDVQKTLQYISLKPAKSSTTEATVLQVQLVGTTA